MQNMFYTYVTWAGNIALLGVILFRAVKGGFLNRYVVFYGYIAISLAIALGAVPVTAVYGLASRQYYYFFTVTTVLITALQLWVVYDLYRRISANDKRSVQSRHRRLGIAAVLAAPTWWGVFSLDKHLGFKTKFQVITLPLLVMACLLVYQAVIRRPQAQLGRNLKGILSGLSLMVAFRTINISHFLFGKETVQIFLFFGPFIDFLALVNFAYMLWNYEPMRPLDQPRYQPTEVGEERLLKINRQLQQALKSLILHR